LEELFDVWMNTADYAELQIRTDPGFFVGFSDVFFSLSECDDICEKVPEELRNADLFLL
jgi:hypothetical protein